MATSFRDPAGHVLQVNGRVLRFVNHSGQSDLQAFLNSPAALHWIGAGSLVQTRVVPDSELSEGKLWQETQASAALVLEHERVAFQSFPYEWPPEMLHAAGELTLDMAQSLLKDGFGLKDATPYNILFRGPQPVFIDWLSFQKRDPCDPAWNAYAQFVRTFMLPLLVNKYLQLPLDQMLLSNRDGLEPEQVYRLTGPVRRILPPFLSLVSLPSWLAKEKLKANQTYAPRRVNSPAKAQFILNHLFNGLQRKLRSVLPERSNTSAWSDYMSNNRYTEDYFPLKESFVRSALAECRPARVLDVGCNTGFFSKLCAKTGASIVGIDSDPIVVGRLWHEAKAESLDVLPLVVNLARPTPSTGWLNAECSSFLERSRGAFDLVLMLAVVHHMLVSERIPLRSILSLVSELTSAFLLIEYVPPDDPKFREIARGRDHLHADLTREVFEAEYQPFFETIRKMQLGETGRWLYLLRRRG